MIRIWINQGFSLHGLVRAIGASRPDVDLCVSAIDPCSPVRAVAPTFWIEPGRAETDYTAWVLDTATANGVEAIMVQRGRRGVAARAADFAAADIALHVSATPDVLALLDDKAAFSTDMAGDDLLCRTIAVTSTAQFIDAVRMIESDGSTACVKPARGIYGAGYWTLGADDPFVHLADPDQRLIATAMFAAGLRAREEDGVPFSLIVMEHLPGLEASIDIVARHGEMLVAGVRIKLDANRQHIATDHVLTDHAAMLVRRYALHGAVNIQYRQDRDGRWRILEINTRPAGGAFYCEAVGIPFAATWMDVALGRAERFTGHIDREVMTLVRPMPVGGQAGVRQDDGSLRQI